MARLILRSLRRLFPIVFLSLMAVLLNACGASNVIVITATPGPTATERVLIVTATQAPAIATDAAPIAPTLTPRPILTAEPTKTLIPSLPTKDVVVVATPPAKTAIPPLPTKNVVAVPSLRKLDVFAIDGQGAQVVVFGLPVVKTMLSIRVAACATPCDVEKQDGSGITEVSFAFFTGEEATGDPVYVHTEKNAAYCAFGGGEPDCTVWDFAQHRNQWPTGKPLIPGAHVVQMTVRGNDQNNAFWAAEALLSIGEPPSTRTDILSKIDYLRESDFTQPFVIRVAARAANGAKDGDGIDSVRFEIFDESGQRVHDRTERNAKFCAFGGGEPDCTPWLFSEHSNQWPSGQALASSEHSYTLRVTVLAKNGATKRDQVTFKLSGPS